MARCVYERCSDIDDKDVLGSFWNGLGNLCSHLDKIAFTGGSEELVEQWYKPEAALTVRLGEDRVFVGKESRKRCLKLHQAGEGGIVRKGELHVNNEKYNNKEKCVLLEKRFAIIFFIYILAGFLAR
jgi:hypothetical protein